MTTSMKLNMIDFAVFGLGYVRKIVQILRWCQTYRLLTEEASHTYLTQESLDTRGKDVHKLLLKFASVEATVKDLEERLVDLCAYPLKEALRMLLSGLDIDVCEEHVNGISLECKMSKEDVEDDMIGHISLPGKLHRGNGPFTFVQYHEYAAISVV